MANYNQIDLSNIELDPTQASLAIDLSCIMYINLEGIESVRFGDFMYAVNDAMQLHVVEREAGGVIPETVRVGAALAMKDFGFEVSLPKACDPWVNNPSDIGGQNG